VQVDSRSAIQLTYCTNIHPADGWPAVFENIRQYAPLLRQQLSPSDRFGIGLRLSAREADELLEPGRLDEFRSFLDGNGLYVALLNGFPYGSFHGTAVKDKVFAPDWTHEARLQYTLDLIEVLTRLLPEDLDGGVSTIPLSYKPWTSADKPADWEAICRNLARAVEVLVRARQGGRLIHIDVEPEPDGLLENSDELIRFFEHWLLPVGGSRLASALGVTLTEAQVYFTEHIQVCFDCCHFAVEYEEPGEALRKLNDAGIRIGRVQLSSALKVDLPSDARQRADTRAKLRPFAESTYLHQVIERRDGSFARYPDLDSALDVEPDADARQWRIHFHVPLFTEEYEQFSSTQDCVREVLAYVRQQPMTRHLEIETYTWDVLPVQWKVDLLESIRREYDWVLSELHNTSPLNRGC
jgi:sugar phosphate isomerase/epimerase